MILPEISNYFYESNIDECFCDSEIDDKLQGNSEISFKGGSE
jgi:hypothetical protein